MDIQMPEMDGLTAATKIRKQLKLTEIPIIAMTAHAMAGDAQKSILAGMNEHLTKPIDPETLYQTLSNYLLIDNVKKQKTGKIQIINVEKSSILQQLQSCTHLNTALALKQVQGKQPLYLELVKDFYHKHKAEVSLALTLFQQNDWEKLYRTAHSLKSSAQYIGAENLANAAINLEKEIEDKGIYVEREVNKVCHKLNDVIETLALIYQVDEPSTRNNTGRNKVFDVNSAKNILLKLKPLVDAADIEAEDISLKLYQLSQETNYFEEINHLHLLINDYEFEQAQIAISVLEQSMGNESLSKI